MAATKFGNLCFEDNAIAHARGKITTEEYLEGMLCHLTGVRHAQDTPLKRINSDGLSMAIQSCLFETNFKCLKDVSIIKRLLLTCWYGNLDIELLGPKVLAALQPFCISDKILLAMICISITRRDLALLKYCFTLTDSDAVFWAATTSPTLVSAAANPDPIIWDVLLDNGWSRPSGQYWEIASSGLAIKELPGDQTHQERLATLAMIAMKDPRRIDLLNVLFSHGLRVSNSLLNKAAVSADPPTMKTLLENCDDEMSDVNESKALLVAAGSNGRIVETLLDFGFGVNWKAPHPPLEKDKSNEKVKKEKEEKRKHSPSDKKQEGDQKGSREHKEHKEHREHREHEEGGTADSRTALHVAAAMGNFDAVKILLEHGAKTDITDSQGRTPEQTALENGTAEIAKLLKVIHDSRRK
ncbi:ankyrin [Acephala macrosclerotiorum]|nr:ankyrin [Acephala macrosclerotiorum]